MSDALDNWTYDPTTGSWRITSTKPTPNVTTLPPGLQTMEDWLQSAGVIDTELPVKTIKCTCGSSAVGSPKHSDWCDIKSTI